jgi:hypothetical protein
MSLTHIEPRAVLQGMVVLVGALAWNEVAKKAVEHIVPHQNGIRGVTTTLVYALSVTLLIVIVVCSYNRMQENLISWPVKNFTYQNGNCQGYTPRTT